MDLGLPEFLSMIPSDGSELSDALPSEKERAPLIKIKWRRGRRKKVSRNGASKKKLESWARIPSNQQQAPPARSCINLFVLIATLCFSARAAAKPHSFIGPWLAQVDKIAIVKTKHTQFCQLSHAHKWILSFFNYFFVSQLWLNSCRHASL